MDKSKSLFFSLILFSIVFISTAHALQINGYDPVCHDRFLPGTYASNPQDNSSFYLSSYDWSGVGWETNSPSRSVALVSPLHFVGANHWRIPVGNTITFKNNDGILNNYTVGGYHTLTYTTFSGTFTPDLVVGCLTDPIPDADNITYYPVTQYDSDGAIPPGFYPDEHFHSNDWYLGKEIFVYGWSARVGTGTFEGLQGTGTVTTNLTRTFDYLYHVSDDPQYLDEPFGVGGDSGSPTFLPWEGSLALLGTHFAHSPGETLKATYDSFIPAYISDINSAISLSGYSLNVLNVIPEPSTFLCFVCGIIMLFYIMIKGRKRAEANRDMSL
ncbi:MAG: hypothetical protein KAS46_05530 [Candidatus Aureabacteria bacterium]|nr:hypothetical protein [Candidatus Auribacterota bacterium]